MSSTSPDPQAANALIAQGKVLLQQGQKLEARRCFLQAAALDPNNPEVWSSLAAVASGQAQAHYLERAKTLQSSRKPQVMTSPLRMAVGCFSGCLAVGLIFVCVAAIAVLINPAGLCRILSALPIPEICTPVATSAPVPTDRPTPTEEVVSSLQDAKKAIIRIEAQGTFADPEGQVVNTPEWGSGFIISPEGIAVTNNHVVTGAALLKVWVGGESNPRKAEVLGASECSDLAVIDIEGDGYPYLQWYIEEIEVGLDVYAAGFPLGDPEFTLTRGIVSKAHADGETSWASVEAVIEHDATINPGSSGGPLIDVHGRVVGINYASSPSTDQYYAIAAQDALGIIQPLQQGEDVESIGINGQAVVSQDGSISGIWVSSVKSGSPADKAGVQTGDFILTLEGFVIGTEGTMAAYCDVLRSHGPDDILSIEVFRYATREVLAGQINGQKLEPRYSFEEEQGSQANGDGSNSYTEYMAVKDDTGTMQMEIPVEWSDVSRGTWVDQNDREIGIYISAAPNLENWRDIRETPGVFVGASAELARSEDYIQVLNERPFEGECTLDRRYDYVDPVLKGAYDVYTDCGGPGGPVFLQFAAQPVRNPDAYMLLVQFIGISEADFEALDHIIQTLTVAWK